MTSKRVRLSARPTNVAPDAAASYLGTYTVANPWTLWLLEHEPDLLASSPSSLQHPDEPPLCPKPCGAKMKYRPGAWSCYLHEETVRVAVRPKYELGTVYDDNDEPIRDVTELLSLDVDVLYFSRPGERPKWRLVKR